MCGIIEYIGHRKAYDVLVQELHRLEYRGYDSASVAVMKHGSIALIDHDMPTVDIAPNYSLHSKIVSNIQQVKSRGGSVIAIVTKGDTSIKQLANYCWKFQEFRNVLLRL